MVRSNVIFSDELVKHEAKLIRWFKRYVYIILNPGYLI